VLVLIDQHAADERVRVEFFLKELFMGFLHSEDHTQANQTGGVRVKELNPPWPVLLTQQEALTIKRSQDARKMLHQWGVRITESSTDLDNAEESGSSTGYSQLFVSSIPEVVSDKLLQGDELRDFIKGFLGQIQSGELLFSTSHLDLPPEADEDEFFWFKAVRRCPRGLLDLVNSKACRGAIMFNDSLSETQCETLVKQLSKTVFPFQCAHGRPSLVPLVETGALQAMTHIRQRSRKDWNRLETMGDA
jgi:DNA mismatch repair protein MLH3